MGLRVLLDVSALLLEPFSREGVGGPRGLTRRNKEDVLCLVQKNIHAFISNIYIYIYVIRDFSGNSTWV